MDCPKGTFPNPVKTKTYPNECENRRRCPDNYRKTKRKGCIRKSARVYKKKVLTDPSTDPKTEVLVTEVHVPIALHLREVRK